MDNSKAGNEIFIDDVLRLIREDFLYIMNDEMPINSVPKLTKTDAKTEIEWVFNLIKRRVEDKVLYI